jgi:hypothetical protein
MPRLIWLTMALVACTGSSDGDSTDTDKDGDNGGGDPFSQFVNVDVETKGGVFTGFTPSTDFESATWLDRPADPAKQADVSLTLLVEDFESDKAVTDATTEVWLADVADGAPDLQAISSDSGTVDFSLPTCTAMSYRTSTNPALDETKVSIGAHKVVPYNGGAAPTEQETFTSVSKTTYQLIPSILGISPDPAKAIVAGTAYDVTGVGKIEGAQIIVYDAAGDIVTDAHVKYFVDEFPNRGQEHTSEDGLWVAINIPPGALRVEMWGVVDGTLGLLGATQIQSYADTINLGNIYAGNGTGVFIDDSCLGEGGGGDTDDTDDTDDSDTDG